MALNNLDLSQFTNKTGVAPNAVSGVRNQLRFWGLGGASSSGRSLPDQHNKMSQYGIDEAANLNRLQTKIADMQVAGQQADLNVQAGQMEDQSAMQHEQLDAQQPDTLDNIGRGAAAIQGAGQAIRGITGAAAESPGSPDWIKKTHKFMERIPLIGINKESRKANEMYEKLDIAFKENNKLHQAAVLKLETMTPNIVKEAPHLKTEIGSSFNIDGFIPEPSLFIPFDTHLSEFTRIGRGGIQ